MTPFETQLNDLLEGTLEPSETVTLARSCERSGDTLRELVDTYRLHRLLSAKYDLIASDPAENVLAQIRRESHPLVDSVLRAIPVPRRGLLSWSREGWSAWRQPTGRVITTAAACAMALLLGVALWAPVMGRPRLAEVRGSGRVERGKDLLPATAGMNLAPSDILRTGDSSTITIGFGKERTRLELKAGAALQVQSWAHGKRFHLLGGALEANVARQRPFAWMRIATPQAEAKVVGTRFLLEATPNRTQLDVSEGKVLFTRTADAKSVLVRAGRQAVAASTVELSALPFTGGVLREFWTNAPMNTLRSTIVLNVQQDPRSLRHPDYSELSSNFELRPVQTNQLLVRFRGYVHPPISGNYEFWLAAGGLATLRMSADEQPKETVQIAQAQDRTQVKQWDGPQFQGPSPWSGPIPLRAGHRYYIEALLLVETGEGHLSVAWKGPGRPQELLSAQFLSPFEGKK